MLNRTVRMSIGLVAVLLALGGVAKGNLITNGDMEMGGGPTTPPTDWIGSTTTSTVGVNTTDFHSGTQSMQIHNNSASGITGLARHYDIPVEVGKTYTYEFWYKGVDTGVYYSVVTDTGSYLAIDLIDTTGVWTNVTRELVIPEGATKLEVRFYPVAAGGTILVDDVSLVPEPVSIAVLGLGGLGLLIRKYHRFAPLRHS